jgi:hypothetical protein
MNPTEGLRSIWAFFSTVPCQSENKDALLAIASIAAVLWTGGVIAIQLDPNRARAKAVLAMEYLQFAFFAPAVGLVAEPFVLRAIATILAVVIFFIGVKHIRDGVNVRHWERIMGPAGDRLRLGIIEKNLLYYGRWTVASTIGAVVVAMWPTQTTVAWTALVVGFIGLQLVVRFLNLDEG